MFDLSPRIAIVSQMKPADYSYDGMPIDSTLVDESDGDGVFAIVRVKTNWWHDAKGLYQRKDVRFMKKLSKGGYNCLAEDCPNIGADEVFCAITNLDKCNDGLYSVHPCNYSHDYESGEVDSYDYILIPYTAQPKQP